MKSLKEIRRRIEVVRGTQKITRAMKLIAAARLKAAERAALGGRDYAIEIHRSVERISKRLGARAPEMWRRMPSLNCMDVLVVTSDRGLCGGFNENLLRFVEEGCREHECHNIPVKLYAIGRKGWIYFKNRGYDVELVPSDGGYDKISRWVVNAMMLRFLAGESAGGFVCFNRYISATRYEISSWNMLPLYSHGDELEKEIEYIFEPERDLALDFFASEMLMSTVRQSMLESKASEHAARIIAMTSASKNADDMVKHLTGLYNRARQEAITSELMDVVGGAEALKAVASR